MSRKPEEDVTLTCPINDVEQDVCAEMMRMLGITSQANLVRLGLYHLAQHCDVPCGYAIFAARHSHGGAKVIVSDRIADRVLKDADIVEPRQPRRRSRPVPQKQERSA